MSIKPLVFAGIFICGQAWANEHATPWYIAAEVGQAKSQVERADIDRLLSANNVNANTVSLDDSDTAWTFHLGYQAHENIAIEAGYMDLGERTLEVTGLTADETSFYNQIDNLYPEAAEGISAALAFRWPMLDKQLYLTGKLGYFDWEGDYSSVSGGQNIGTDRDRGTDFWTGVSLAYTLNSHWSLSANYRRINLERDDNEVLTAGITYRF